MLNPYLRNKNEDEMCMAIFYFHYEVSKIEVFISMKYLSKGITVFKIINLILTSNN